MTSLLDRANTITMSFPPPSDGSDKICPCARNGHVCAHSSVRSARIEPAPKHTHCTRTHARTHARPQTRELGSRGNQYVLLHTCMKYARMRMHMAAHGTARLS
jgi:hypothetical protein